MTKFEQMEKIENSGIVAIIRTDTNQDLLQVVDAIHSGGIDVIEITMTTPGALDTVGSMTKRYGSNLLVGAGSVLDTETARLAILSGADFIVSPITKPDVIELCNRYGKVVMPGAFTPTEILRAWELGADYVKVFPADIAGASYIKAVKAPLPQVSIIPTGGIGLNNAAEFITSGSAALGVGSTLVNKQTITEKQFKKLTEISQKLVVAVKKAKETQAQ
ncbi:MAG: bifunctional 4-hydroxy-2-oxoglutarate aldolase/2-dehydro-3-deoxy-phosphogluconate aldolase [Candidatus Poribacteria bacterium]|nr:bifunctional 4-hydroxy-2-oxoglutarate aldolase/2-dehydro-3-deoxy-phosphogluconate aldolase [Candidatus Poribacteria bacterium]